MGILSFKNSGYNKYASLHLIGNILFLIKCHCGCVVGSTWFYETFKNLSYLAFFMIPCINNSDSTKALLADIISFNKRRRHIYEDRKFNIHTFYK